jgi:hypothetical protein
VIGPDVGALPIDISRPGADFDDLGLPSPAPLLLEGALTSTVSPLRQWPPGVEGPFTQRLEDLIELPPGVDGTVLRPPIYGSFQAGTPDQLPNAGGPRPWLRELNLDPSWRVGAALGTAVVQQLQEQLMASAWDQAGELERANGLLRQAELARSATAAVREKHLDGLPADAALRLTEPVHGRVRVGADGTPLESAVPRTLRGSVRTSVFPQSAVSPPFRRAVRPAGPLGRRLSEPPQQATGRLAGGLALGELRVPVRPARGGADFDEVGDHAVPTGQERPRFQHLREHITDGAGWEKIAVPPEEDDGSSFYVGADPYASATAAAPAARVAAVEAHSAAAPLAATALRIEDGWLIDEPGVRGERLRKINNCFKAAAEFLLSHLPAAATAPAPPGPALALAPVADTLVRGGGVLEADVTVAREVVGLVPPNPAAGDPLRPRAAAPQFPQPMSGPLNEVDSEMLLPGIDRIAQDSVGVLVGNARFIEAYMAGLNHELSRELLWRGLPTDLAATFADRFWDTRGGGDDLPQLSPIAGWQAPLGGNAPAVGGPETLVVIVRGRLLQRYPHTAVYLAKAVQKTDAGGHPVTTPDGAPVPAPGPDELLPRFRGTIEPDVTYLGFDVSIDEARGDDGGLGWFIVVQEQPTAPRFGLDEPNGNGTASLESWSDLDWSDLYPPGTDLSTVRYAAVAGPLSSPVPLELPVLGGRPVPTATWGADSARMAAITYQRPMRVSIHARTALPPKAA